MRRYTVRINDVDYVLDVAEVNPDSYIVSLGDGQVFDVALVSDQDLGDAPESIATSRGTQAASVVTAPLPGGVLSINAAVGTHVKRGDTLLVLEAMKMENDIRATHDGVVKAIHVSVGDQVQHGDALIELGG